MRASPLLAPLLAAGAYATPVEMGRRTDSTTTQNHPRDDYPSASPANSPVPSSPPVDQCAYWLEDVKHQGVAAFNTDPQSYQVFRNVKDFGAKGDGATDDTRAINRAISFGDRCAPGSCNSSTTQPAVVYFPTGIYMINSSIIDYYYTQMIGNPNCLPTIKAFSTYAASNGSIGMIEGDPNLPSGTPAYGSTNIFWRQIRNFIIDMTLVPAENATTGIHWPTAQATSIQNVVFEMSSDKGTQHQGILVDSGSGGFMNDLIFNGGLTGAAFGNQQFTMRNFTINNAVTAITQIYDWGWTYYHIAINNCSVGLDIYSGGPTGLAVGSATFFDSTISNTRVGIRTGYTNSSKPPAANSLILENVQLVNVPIAVEGGNNQTALQGTPANPYISAWGEGHSYTPNGPNVFKGFIKPNTRPASLIGPDGRYYQRSKPQYEQYALSDFISARDLGVTGDGHTDDTAALQNAINVAASQNKILFVDHGDYLVSSTIHIVAGSRIVGESYSVILSSGEYFNDMANPKPVVQIGVPGEEGTIEWSDMIVSTQGQQRGAILFEYNIRSSATLPSGVWDVHARIGGFQGSNLRHAHCPSTPKKSITAANLEYTCIAAYLTVHITPSTTGLYLENNWIWTADHDVEDPTLRQITVYSGRGLLDESAGPVWLVGTAVEHHVKYEYQFANAANVFAGQIQTETAYYQPNPSAPLPFPYVEAIYDPRFPQKTAQTRNYTIPAADGWGLRILDSNTIFIYGAGFYSFFDNYSTDCSDQGNGEICQNHIFSVEGTTNTISIYNENTVGTHNMITVNGVDKAFYAQNRDGFVDTVALFRI